MSEIPDLTSLPYPPFWMARELEPLPTELPISAIGWLGATVPSQGAVPEEVIDRLVAATNAEKYFGDHTCGFHICEICTKPDYRPRYQWRNIEVELYGKGFYLVEHNDRAFVAPRLLIHYILAHRYRPPDEFLDAVVKGSFLKQPPIILTPEQIKEIERQRHELAHPRPAWQRELVNVLFGVLFTGAVLGIWKLVTILLRR